MKKNHKKINTNRTISSLEDISYVLKTIRFKKHFGGIDEQDVWEKIRYLDEMYRKVFFIQEQKYRLLLEIERQKIETQMDVLGEAEDE